jgi:hypothetical protein
MYSVCLPKLTVVKMQGLGEQMLMMAKLSDHDFDMSEGILKGINCEIDVK